MIKLDRQNKLLPFTKHQLRAFIVQGSTPFNLFQELCDYKFHEKKKTKQDAIFMLVIISQCSKLIPPGSPG